MIEMFVNGRQLLLPEDIAVRMEINHPAFETDCIPANIVYSFDLPEEHNEKILNYVNYAQTSGKYREYDWRMSYNGIPIFRGKLIVKQAGDVFRCAASIRQLPSDFGERNITDFDFPAISFKDISMSLFVDRVRAGWGCEIAFPAIYAPLLYGDGESSSNPDWGNIINPETPLENTSGNKATVIPLFYLVYVLQTILKSENYAVDFSRMDDFVNELLLFNNYTLDAFPVDYYVFSNQEGQDGIILTPTVDKYGCVSFPGGLYNVREPGEYDVNIVLRGKFTSDIYPDKTKTLIKVELVSTDPNNPSGSGMTETIATKTVDYFPHAQETIHEFADVIYTRRFSAGQQFRFRMLAEIQGTSSRRLFKFTFGYVEIKRVQGSGAVDGGADRNDYAREIVPVNHLPEVSVADLMLAQKQIFGVIWLFDNGSARIQAILSRDLLRTGTLDLTALCINNSLDIQINEPIAYLLKYESEEAKIAGYEFAGAYIKLSAAPKPRREKLLIRVENLNSYYESKIVDEQFKWVRLGDTYKPYQTHVLSKKETVDIKAAPLGMAEYNLSALPYFGEQGVSPMFLPGTSKTDKLLLLLRRSPLTASTTNISESGVVDPAAVTFNFDGENGLYRQLLKTWYDFISAANEYTFDFKVNTEDMLRILELFKPQDRPVTEQIRRVRIGNQVYVPKQFSFELTNTGIKCQAKLIK